MTSGKLTVAYAVLVLGMCTCGALGNSALSKVQDDDLIRTGATSKAVTYDLAKAVAHRYAIRLWPGCHVGDGQLYYGTDGTPEVYFFVICKAGVPTRSVEAMRADVAAIRQQRLPNLRESPRNAMGGSEMTNGSEGAIWREMSAQDKYGTVVVGANEGREPFIASYDGLPPHVLLYEDAIAAARAHGKTDTHGEPRYVWWPPLFTGFAFGTTEGGQLLLGVRGCEFILVPVLKSGYVSPAPELLLQRRLKWVNVQTMLETSSSDGAGGAMAGAAAQGYISGVPDYQQDDFDAPPAPGDNDCCPTAAACVLGYWDAHGYANLIAGSPDWLSNPTGITDLVNLLKTTMGYPSGPTGGVLVANIPGGITSAVTNRGYSFVSDNNPGTWHLVTGEIDAGRPSVFTIDHPDYNAGGWLHSVASVGYEEALGSGGTVTLLPTADTYVYSYEPNANYGSEVAVFAEYFPDPPDPREARALMRFDLQGVQTVTTARLRLWCNLTDMQPTDTVSFWLAGSEWSESTVTWNAHPSPNLSCPPAIVSAQAGNQYWEIDVTQLVRRWVGGQASNYGFLLSVSGRRVFFASKESVASWRPQLIVSGGADNIVVVHDNWQTTDQDVRLNFSECSSTTLTRVVPGGVQDVTIGGYAYEPLSGAGIAGVAMNGLPGTPSTDSSGYYSATVPSGWSGTVTPGKGCYTFSPQNRTYANVQADQENQDYIGSLVSYTISGRVTLSGVGVPGVTMTGLPGGPSTDTTGTYSGTVPCSWSGTVTPSLSDYVFLPELPGRRSYASVSCDMVGEDYLMPGDVEGDLDVDVFDVIGVVSAFGATPGSLHWDPLADFNCNQIVDVFDVIGTVKNFGMNLIVPPSVTNPRVTGELAEGVPVTISASCTATDADGFVQSVEVDLSPIGGSSAQALAKGVDNTWSWSGSVTPPGSGPKTIRFTATDNDGATDTATLEVVVGAAPDLVPGNLVCPGEAAAGDTLVCMYNVRNDGDEASGYYVVRWYLSRDPALSGDDRRLDEHGHTSLPAHSYTADLPSNLSLPSYSDPFWTGDGEYYIIMSVDPDNLIPETNETNNQLGRSIVITVTLPYSCTFQVLHLERDVTCNAIPLSSISPGRKIEIYIVVTRNGPGTKDIRIGNLHIDRDRQPPFDLSLTSGGESVGPGKSAEFLIRFELYILGTFEAEFDIQEWVDGSWVTALHVPWRCAFQITPG